MVGKGTALISIFACYHQSQINKTSPEAYAYGEIIRSMEQLAKTKTAYCGGTPCECDKPYRIEYFVGSR